MTGRGAKLITVILVTVILVSLFGYSILTPKMSSQVATYTSQQTSVTSQSLTTLQSSMTSSTVTSSTTLAETVQWINVSGNHPISYYLKLLESNGTEPYVQLATELQKIPDLTNATAAKITYLALNASNPEVKEAFELMMKGGTPDPKDLTAALAGIPKAKVWTNIAQSIPLRTALIVGDAVRVPTVVDVLDYGKIEGMLKTAEGKRMTSEEIKKIAKNAEKIVKSIG